mmetsp:Transcript_21724/g.30688  ORF Transcript_21724/g.30688 Transcript_21724/m.30688 type:complete len:341 (-) Transcript_21724:29-1051(-)|eukprot:CAMPEP_0175142636 /NCGR_PEP_ID=MMETSP0087-20121206/12929_1 /TAXON_ID=136419 /ORGANISM="Unknown Unknown, Strain D1" /LENGTH=340 /DNA_ID=CAMNT_0016426501 /DNA_START=28 /DNA_END=1050 /DNA_ORIENTATION=-
MPNCLWFVALLSFAGAQAADTFDVVGWYVGDDFSAFPPEQLNWNVYSNIRFGGPLVDSEGFATCNRTDTLFQRMAKVALQHKKKITWAPGAIDVWQLISNSSWATFRSNYIGSIGQAVQDCSAAVGGVIAGIEIDYECPPTVFGHGGIVSHEEALNYTQFLVQIQHAMGPGYEISADVGVWGLDGIWHEGDSYPFLLTPWINVELLKKTENMFINTMSYHHSKSCSITEFKIDAAFAHNIWGIPKDRINLGIGYYSFNKTNPKSIGEPSWSSLSKHCPNIAPNLCICDDVLFVGKQQNFEIGKFVREEGYRGVFPWAANYDSLTNNNTLISYLGRGLGLI